MIINFLLYLQHLQVICIRRFQNHADKQSWKLGEQDQAALDVNNLTISKDTYKKRIKETEKLYDPFSAENIIKIKPENIICTFKNRCLSYANGRFIYLDDIHFGPEGTILLANEIIKDLNLENK